MDELLIYKENCLFVCLLCPMHGCICGQIWTKLCKVAKGALLTMDMGMWNYPMGWGSKFQKKAVAEVTTEDSSQRNVLSMTYTRPKSPFT